MIAMIAAIAEKKFSDRSDHMETTFQRSQRQPSLRYNFFYLRDRCRCDRYDLWKVVSI